MPSYSPPSPAKNVKNNKEKHLTSVQDFIIVFWSTFLTLGFICCS